MLKAVSWSSYEKSGCINCGCAYCYNESGISGGGSVNLKCGECGKPYVILADGLEKSNVGYGTNEKDEDGKTIYYYPTLEKHPREGIPKHKYVKEDVRPENGIGEYCNPRGVGYDLACFVKSKEAGQRITDMINKVNEKHENKAFNCWLDYRSNEPNWIQVKINYPSKLRATILARLINDNECVITEEIVENAINEELNFQNYWKYIVGNKIYGRVDNDILQNIESDFHNLSPEERNCKITYSFERFNSLIHFEMLAIFYSVNYEIEKGNLEKAAKMLISFFNSRHATYLCELRMNNSIRKKESSNNLMDYVYKEVELLFKHYSDNISQDIKQHINSKEFIYDEEYCGNIYNILVEDWKKIRNKITSELDFDSIKYFSKYLSETTEEDTKKIKDILENNKNIYLQFILFGLYTDVSVYIDWASVSTLKNKYSSDILRAVEYAIIKYRSLSEYIKEDDKIKDIYEDVIALFEKYIIKK